MAELIRDPRQVKLSPNERKQLVGRLEQNARAWAESRFAVLPPVPGHPEQPRIERRSEPAAGEHPEGLSSRLGGEPPARMIQGPFQGLETPPFDGANVILSSQGNVICAPYAGQTPTGELLVRLFTGQGPQIDAWANAGIWFWAIPSARGPMAFYPARGWDLVTCARGVTLRGGSATGALHIRSGISVCTLQPFSAAPISDITDIFPAVEFQIGQNSLYPGPDWWDTYQTESSSAQPHISGSSYVATLPHAYACWTWITAAVSTRGDAGAWIDVSLNLPGFWAEVP
jgi:hypothetical protein